MAPRILLASTFVALLLSSTQVGAVDVATPVPDVEKVQDQVRGFGEGSRNPERIVHRKVRRPGQASIGPRSSSVAAGQPLGRHQQPDYHGRQLHRLHEHWYHALGVCCSFITYFNAKSRAEAEAREASKKWFEENAARLIQEVASLRQKVQDSSKEMEAHAKRVADTGQATIAEIQVTREKVDAAGKAILQPALSSGQAGATAAASAAVVTVKDVSEALKSKPEADFTPEEHYARGLDRFAIGDYVSALQSFKAAASVEAPLQLHPRTLLDIFSRRL